MKGDFTRDTFDPNKHFLRVLQQQGRVALDADWNEQVAILLHYMQTLAADLIGPHGGPVGNCGFLILNGHDRSFGIGRGRYYVNGILCDNQATPVLIISSATNGQTEITVSSLNPDSLPFRVDEYVEVFTLNQQQSVLAKITSIKENNVLVLEPPVQASLKAVRRADTYTIQPYFPNPQPDLEEGDYVVYLDVWERHISHLEDESIREVALGGPDTTSRSKVIWQVKVQKLDGVSSPNPCAGAFSQLAALPLSTALLKARTKKPEHPAIEEPCVLPPEARYRGTENRLYRVEIHTGNLNFDGTINKNVTPTFKWSRDNGSVILAVRRIDKNIENIQSNTTKVWLASLGSGCEISLAVGDWVEIVDDESILMNKVPSLLKVISIDSIDRTAILDGVLQDIDLSKHPLLRRWNFKPIKGGAPTQAMDNALLIEEGTWLTLENGIQIWFEKTDGEQKAYRTGDYWLIPARVETGDIEWPEITDAFGKPLKALSPRGVLHHYAPLAILSVDAQGQTTRAHDCRSHFSSLAEPIDQER